MHIIYMKQKKEKVKIEGGKEHMAQSFGESTQLFVV